MPKKILRTILVGIIVFIFSLYSVSGSHAQTSNVSLSIIPNNTNVNTNSSGSFAIKLATPTYSSGGIDAYQIFISFNPSIINIDTSDIVMNTGSGSPFNGWTKLYAEVNESNSQIRISFATISDPYAGGTVNIATVNFDTLSTGTSNLTFAQDTQTGFLNKVALNGSNVLSTTNNGSITVSVPPTNTPAPTATKTPTPTATTTPKPTNTPAPTSTSSPQPTPSTAPGDITTGLVGHWKMDEFSWVRNCSSLTVIDSSSKNNTGLACPGPHPNGPQTSTTNPQVGSHAGSFDGVDDYILANALMNDLSLPVSWSLAGWVNINNLNGQQIAAAFVDANGSEIVGFGNIFTNFAIQGNSIQNLFPNTWTHLALVWNGNSFTTFVNGSLDKTVEPTTQPNWALLDSFHIGNAVMSGQNDYYFTGLIDDIRVYNRALSATDVSTLYVAGGGVPPTTASLTFQYRYQGVTKQRPSQNAVVTLVQGSAPKSQKAITVNSNDQGVYTGTLIGIEPGIYDIYIKSGPYLQKKFSNINLAIGPNQLNWSTQQTQQLRAGDVNNDNTISIEDIADLFTVYTDFSISVSPGSQYDLNFDSAVTIEDIALTLLNFSDLNVPGDSW